MSITDLGKGVRLKGNTLEYTKETPAGKIKVRRKLKLDGDTSFNIAKDFNIGRAKISLHGKMLEGKKPDSAGIKIKIPFSEGSKGKTIGKELTNRQMINKLYKENPTNPQIKKAWAASQSDIENWENMVPIKLKNKYFKKNGGKI
jgi:hypothetical protein